MSDPAEKCPSCRHAAHFASMCFNMQSDNDCFCKDGDPQPAPPIPIRPTEPVEVPREMRHPTAATAEVTGWRPLTAADRLLHIGLGDIIDTLDAIGYEIRLQIREKPGS